ncbi:hypothetical protein ACWPM1_01210 [Tsuneonella sp. HG249]
MKYAGVKVSILIFLLWGLTIVPIWLLGMGFAGEFRLFPDDAFSSIGGFAFFVAMYLPPLFGLALLMRGGSEDV